MSSRLAPSLVVVLAFVVGCNEKKPARKLSAPAAALPVPQAPPAPPAPAVIPSATHQLVVAIPESWTSTHAQLQRWERTEGGPWIAVGAPWPGVLGKAGSAWGAGLHGAGAPAGLPGGVKQEGDKKSPAGAFAIRAAYGTAEEPPKATKLDYESTARGDFECINDPASEHYASIVDRKQVPADWESSETLLRDDALYTWVIDVAHNPERTPRAGSCIFLHVWSGPESTTIGCTAMAEPRLRELVGSLDPAHEPVFVLLPRAEYQALQVAWGLPPP